MPFPEDFQFDRSVKAWIGYHVFRRSKDAAGVNECIVYIVLALRHFMAACCPLSKFNSDWQTLRLSLAFLKERHYDVAAIAG
tara:strand:- start:1673 stop:1918 length:246 start_codon:yes stop_codon:yes gene_type:complete